MLKRLFSTSPVFHCFVLFLLLFFPLLVPLPPHSFHFVSCFVLHVLQFPHSLTLAATALPSLPSSLFPTDQFGSKSSGSRLFCCLHSFRFWAFSSSLSSATLHCSLFPLAFLSFIPPLLSFLPPPSTCNSHSSSLQAIPTQSFTYF